MGESGDSQVDDDENSANCWHSTVPRKWSVQESRATFGSALCSASAKFAVPFRHWWGWCERLDSELTKWWVSSWSLRSVVGKGLFFSHGNIEANFMIVRSVCWKNVFASKFVTCLSFCVRKESAKPAKENAGWKAKRKWNAGLFAVFKITLFSDSLCQLFLSFLSLSPGKRPNRKIWFCFALRWPSWSLCMTSCADLVFDHMTPARMRTQHQVVVSHLWTSENSSCESGEKVSFENAESRLSWVFRRPQKESIAR